jgi:hypothetical protein
MKIGIISDTHGYLDPQVEKLFKGVDHIIHAGDIGDALIELELKFIAPVTTVLGNTDLGLHFPETAVIRLGKIKFLIHHIINPHAPSDDLEQRLKRDQPDAVVFGHTHKAFAQTLEGVFYFNPGYAGKPKLGTERCVALLHLNGKDIHHEFIPL